MKNLLLIISFLLQYAGEYNITVGNFPQKHFLIPQIPFVDVISESVIFTL